MQPALHAHLDVAVMVRSAAEDRHCIEFHGAAQHLLERIEHVIAAVAVAPNLTPLRAQISHSSNRPIGMYVPLEFRAESTTHHAQANLAALGLRRRPACL